MKCLFLYFLFFIFLILFSYVVRNQYLQPAAKVIYAIVSHTSLLVVLRDRLEMETLIAFTDSLKDSQSHVANQSNDDATLQVSLLCSRFGEEFLLITSKGIRGVNQAAYYYKGKKLFLKYFWSGCSTFSRQYRVSSNLPYSWVRSNWHWKISTPSIARGWFTLPSNHQSNTHITTNPPPRRICQKSSLHP